MMHDWNWDGSWGGWWGLVMLAAMFLFWGGLIWVVIYAIRGFARPGDPRPRQISAIEVLEERFARGEIDRDEFEERRRVLESKAA
jgi:putative membrane protein